MIVFFVLGWVCISMVVKGLFILPFIGIASNNFIKKIMCAEKLCMGAGLNAPESNGA